MLAMDRTRRHSFGSSETDQNVIGKKVWKVRLDPMMMMMI